MRPAPEGWLESEQQFQADLYRAGWVVLPCNRSKGTRFDVGVRSAEDRRVGQVESLAADLQVEPLGEPNVLEDREVQVAREVLAKRGVRTAHISERVILCDLELRRIEPLIDRASFDLRVHTCRIRTLVPAKREAVVGRLAEDQRLSGIQGQNAVR